MEEKSERYDAQCVQTKMEENFKLYMQAKEMLDRLYDEQEILLQEMKESIRRSKRYIKIQLVCLIGILTNLVAVIIYTIYH